MNTLSEGIGRRLTRNEIQLRRNLLTRNYLLSLNRNLCDGCGVCADNCPKKAIVWTAPVVANGRLVKKPTVDFDVNSCIFCGECATICPLDALKMTIDGEEIATIVKNEAFPVLLKEITIKNEKCKPECKLECQQACPTKAITVSTARSKSKDAPAVKVNIDESTCIYCKQCEAACPFEAIVVKKPFLGNVSLNGGLCPEGCRACVDICPAHAAHLDEYDKPKVTLNFCIYCFACEKVCPEKAINVKREWIFHSDVRSAAWLTALGKLTSFETARKEAASDSGKTRYTRADSRGRGEQDQRS